MYGNPKSSYAAKFYFAIDLFNFIKDKFFIV